MIFTVLLFAVGALITLHTLLVIGNNEIVLKVSQRARDMVRRRLYVAGAVFVWGLYRWLG